MKKYILLPLLASLIIISCGDDANSSELELDTFEFKYDMDNSLNDIKLMNVNTLIKEDNNTFSRVENDINYSFGIEFNGDKISNTSRTPYIYAKLRKDSTSINSNTALVVSCTQNDSLIYWQSVKVDSNFITTPNEWNGFNYNGFQLPESINNETKVAFYFWSVDGSRLDVDNFEVKF